MYGEALGWIEASALGVFARNSGWTYAAVNALHVLGAALLVGAIAVFDIALLRRGLAEANPIGRVAIPLAAGGLALQIATGIVLFAGDARSVGFNLAFGAKLAFIAVGLVNVAAFHARFGARLSSHAGGGSRPVGPDEGGRGRRAPSERGAAPPVSELGTDPPSPPGRVRAALASPHTGKVYAVVSLAAWTLTLLAGRLIAYV